MSVPDHDAPLETMWEGRFIKAFRRGRWEYAGRANGIRAAVILALEAGHVLLVRQYRVPLGRDCLELPAGLIGDEGDRDEDPRTTAARELEEETGYRAARLEAVGEFYSSPGMVSECFTLIRATELTRVSAGGGLEDENITVYRVPIADIGDFVAQKRAEGVAIDVKLLALLGPALLG